MAVTDHSPIEDKKKRQRNRSSVVSQTTLQSLEHDILCFIFFFLELFDLVRCSVEESLKLCLEEVATERHRIDINSELKDAAGLAELYCLNNLGRKLLTEMLSPNLKGDAAKSEAAILKENLDIKYCCKLVNLSKEIANLSSLLQKLYIGDCPKLTSLPKNALSYHKQLRKIDTVSELSLLASASLSRWEIDSCLVLQPKFAHFTFYSHLVPLHGAAMNHTAVGDKKKRQNSRSSVLSQTTVHSLPGARHPLRHLLLPRPLRPRPMLCRLQILGVLVPNEDGLTAWLCRREGNRTSFQQIKVFWLIGLVGASNRSCNSEEPLKLYLEEVAMEHHRLALQEGVIHIDQWRGHSAGNAIPDRSKVAASVLWFSTVHNTAQALPVSPSNTTSSAPSFSFINLILLFCWVISYFPTYTICMSCGVTPNLLNTYFPSCNKSSGLENTRRRFVFKSRELFYLPLILIRVKLFPALFWNAKDQVLKAQMVTLDDPKEEGFQKIPASIAIPEVLEHFSLSFLAVWMKKVGPSECGHSTSNSDHAVKY
ncbi:hypothetical protein FEM48_Zijuj05G0024600 [Ziziphus jujuba var. spinosa]|uniref:Uncharacterized protein n=1 Tax=Ziziphus jujuba var. spinosa TaxID=714518 RepID=A0A978VCA2_ZIZJJ|nr:hypothetical protein FEM48_Zijuj05G0024600 [Ziziphus jujuba var. spinosa]